ncbi:MAG: lytic transglycosylase domain-containing protein [Elusimicrobia bacterium]|nr:lytic transglycosylase domain-containing protein [Elusimicrobiota bacterium]
MTRISYLLQLASCVGFLWGAPAAMPGPAGTDPFSQPRSAPCLGTGEHDRLILRYSERHRLDPRLVKAVVAVESEFNPRAVSRAGAVGLMQLMPATAAEMGVSAEDLTDPETNIRAGTAYLALLFRAAGRLHGHAGKHHAAAPPRVVRRVLAAYNAGPRAMRGQAWAGVTKPYVRKIMRLRRSPSTLLKVSDGPRRTEDAVRPARRHERFTKA